MQSVTLSWSLSVIPSQERKGKKLQQIDVQSNSCRRAKNYKKQYWKPGNQTTGIESRIKWIRRLSLHELWGMPLWNWRREPSAEWVLAHRALVRCCSSLSSCSWYFLPMVASLLQRPRHNTSTALYLPLKIPSTSAQPQPLIVYLASNHFYSLSVNHNIKIVWSMISTKHKEACCDLGLPMDSYKTIQRKLHKKRLKLQLILRPGVL